MQGGELARDDSGSQISQNMCTVMFILRAMSHVVLRFTSSAYTFIHPSFSPMRVVLLVLVFCSSIYDQIHAYEDVSTSEAHELDEPLYRTPSRFFVYWKKQSKIRCGDCLYSYMREKDYEYFSVPLDRRTSFSFAGEIDKVTVDMSR